MCRSSAGDGCMPTSVRPGGAVRKRSRQDSWVRGATDGWRPSRRRRNGDFPREQGWGGTRHRVGASSRVRGAPEPVLAFAAGPGAPCAARCLFCRAASAYLALLSPAAHSATPLLTCDFAPSGLFHTKSRVGVRDFKTLVVVYTGKRPEGAKSQVRRGVAMRAAGLSRAE